MRTRNPFREPEPQRALFAWHLKPRVQEPARQVARVDLNLERRDPVGGSTNGRSPSSQDETACQYGTRPRTHHRAETETAHSGITSKTRNRRRSHVRFEIANSANRL